MQESDPTLNENAHTHPILITAFLVSHKQPIKLLSTDQISMCSIISPQEIFNADDFRQFAIQNSVMVPQKIIDSDDSIEENESMIQENDQQLEDNILFIQPNYEQLEEKSLLLETEGGELDNFGFYIETNQLGNNSRFFKKLFYFKSFYQSEKKKQIIQQNARIEKWLSVLPSLDQLISKQKSQKLIKKKLRKGIPDCLRNKVWKILIQKQKLKSNSQLNYNFLIEQKDFPNQYQIELDVVRTFGDNKYFKIKKYKNNKLANNQTDLQRDIQSSIGLKSLYNVLKAISLALPEMGYCQGLNFIVASFLLYLNDEDAFWISYYILKELNYQQYLTNTKLINKIIFKFKYLMHYYQKPLYNHFKKLQIDLQMFLMQ